MQIINITKMAVKRKSTQPQEVPAPAPVATSQEPSFPWTPQMEVKLFETMLTHKPAGLAKHFNMALIHYKLLQQEGFKDLTSKNIWDHLEGLFDLDKADSTETATFSREDTGATTEFCLPAKDFAEAMAEMRPTSQVQVETPLPSKKVDKMTASATPSIASNSDIATDMDLDEKQPLPGTPKNTPGSKRAAARKTPRGSTKSETQEPAKKIDKTPSSATASTASTSDIASAIDSEEKNLESQTPKSTPTTKRTAARKTPTGSAKRGKK